MTSLLLEWIELNTPSNIQSKFSEPLKNMIKGSKTNLLRVIHYPPFSGKEDSKSLRAAAHGGTEIGFHADEALALAAQTAKGAASLVNDSNDF